MPQDFHKLGYVLTHIYDFDFGAGIYLPTLERYEADTPCIVAQSSTHADESILHQSCIDQGYESWLNVAVVSDTCDEASNQTEAGLIEAFNEDCREGGWLRKMMNYRREDPRS